jgi:hypothetical protein
LGCRIADDRRLNIEHRLTHEVESDDPHMASFRTKAAFIHESPYTSTIFLDADTLVVGRLDELLAAGQSSNLTVTIYGDPVVTCDARVNEPIRRWMELVDQQLLDEPWASHLRRLLKYAYPTINAGVFAIRQGTSVLTAWQQVTSIGRNMPTPDETALQLVSMEYPHRMLGRHFNAIPMFEHPSQDVRIWHFAGVSHLRYRKCQALWLKAYRECRKLNIARLAEWFYVRTRYNQAADSAAINTIPFSSAENPGCESE